MKSAIGLCKIRLINQSAAQMLPEPAEFGRVRIWQNWVAA